FACFYNSPNNLWHYGHLTISEQGIQYNFKGKNIIPGAGVDLNFTWDKVHHFRKVKASNKPSFSKGIEWLDGLDRHLFIFIQDRDKIWEKINKVAVLVNYSSWTNDEHGLGLGLGINEEEDNTLQRTSTDHSGNNYNGRGQYVQTISTSPDQLSSCRTSQSDKYSITSDPSSPSLTGQQGIIYELNNNNHSRGFSLDGVDSFPSTPLTTSTVKQCEDSKSQKSKPELVFQDTFPCSVSELFDYIFSNNHKFTELAHVKHCRNKPLSTLKSPTLSSRNLYEFEDANEKSFLPSNPITKFKYKSMVKYSKWNDNYRTVSYPMPLTSRHPLLRKLHDLGLIQSNGNLETFINIEEKQKLELKNSNQIIVLGQAISNLDKVPREFYLKYTLDSLPPSHTQLTIKLMMKDVSSEDSKYLKLDPYYTKWLEDNFKLLTSHLSQFILKNIYKKNAVIPPTPEINRSTSVRLPPKRPNSELFPPKILNLNAFKRNSTLLNGTEAKGYLEKPEANQSINGKNFKLTQNPIDLGQLLNSKLGSCSPARTKSLPSKSNGTRAGGEKVELVGSRLSASKSLDNSGLISEHDGKINNNNAPANLHSQLNNNSNSRSEVRSNNSSIDSIKSRIEVIDQNSNAIFLMIFVIFWLIVNNSD
ncbi:hypothetical protein CONCODRAFT_12938, partial [Conidiobolus coronatus NRRL 28638]